MRSRQAEVLLQIKLSDLMESSPLKPASAIECPKVNDLNTILLLSKGAVNTKSFAMKHSLGKICFFLFFSFFILFLLIIVKGSFYLC